MLPFDRTGWGLAAWNLAVLVVVLAVTLGTAVLVEARARDADMEHELQLGAQREVVGLLGAQGDDEREHGPEAYEADTPDLFAFWVDRRGAVIRNTRQVNLAGLPDQEGIRAALAGQEQLGDRVVGGVPVRLLSIPAFSEGRVVGAVQVGTSLESAQQAVSQRATIFVLTGLAGAVLAGAGSIFLADRAVRPIREALERDPALQGTTLMGQPPSCAHWSSWQAIRCRVRSMAKKESPSWRTSTGARLERCQAVYSRTCCELSCNTTRRAIEQRQRRHTSDRWR